MKSFKIGNVKLRNPLFLAPMVDVTDLPFRLLCRSAGASMAYTEMLYISQIFHKNRETQDIMRTCDKDSPIGIQIAGNTYQEFKKAIPFFGQYDLVDINCGCPSIRITGNQAGSYLLKNPDKIASMIKVLKNAGLTVTAKIRLGYKKNNVLKVAKTIENAGADALTLHSRLAIHGRSVPADWGWIKIVKENLGIPLIGNGDIFKGEDVEKILEIADGAMIARAAIGDPLVFKRIIEYFKRGREPEFDYKKNLEQFVNYLKLAKKYKLINIRRIKYLGGNFIKNFSNASNLRHRLMQLKTFNEIELFINSINKNGNYF